MNLPRWLVKAYYISGHPEYQRPVEALRWTLIAGGITAALVWLFACSPAPTIHGPHDCSVAGYHKHVDSATVRGEGK